MITLPGYDIQGQIYDSNNTLVYRGYRQVDQRPIVIKMCKQAYPDPEKLYRYQQEFDILKTLNLPGVIQVYDLVLTHDRPYLVLEDFNGISLATLKIAGTLDLLDFLKIAIAITEILENIHHAKIIHKDINLSNIVINLDTQTLKIIDFGIATVLEQETQVFTNPTLLEGTLAYLSPEQTGRMNRLIDYRSDFYALGVTLYELLTGTLPFMSDNALELIHHHIARSPLPAYLALGDVDIDSQQQESLKIISAILDKLLAKNAEDRYQSAYGLKWDLQSCYQQLQHQQRIQFFPLAQQDFTPNLQISQKIYGREAELQQILQAFNSISLESDSEEAKQTQFILISGYSGIGKSALVREIYKPVTGRQGIFITGKYDQYHQTVPYSALNHAFDELCVYLLTEPEESLANWRNLINSALEDQSQILIDFIPKLELIIGPQPEMPKLNTKELQHRLNLIFQNFMEAICTMEHPLVIFLDDLQWADSASLRLLQAILNNHNIKHCLIIGTYRDNEVGAGHPLNRVIDSVREHKNLIEIHLDRLQRDQIAALIMDSLFLDLETCASLADLVYLKTSGNPFFVIEYLKLLNRKGLLYFDRPTSSLLPSMSSTIEHSIRNKGQWKWRIENPDQSRFMDNVVDLMVQKINNLDPLSQNLLKVSACIGNTFDLEKLIIFYGKKFASIYPYLLSLIDLNLIIPLTKNYQFRIPSGHEGSDFQYALQAQKIRFQFAHDRVQQAAYSLWTEREEKITHLRIGKLLYNRYRIPETDAELFDIVSHLNIGKDLIQRSSGFLKELAALNLTAGRRAKQSMAIVAALSYLETGLRCLPENHWQAPQKSYGFIFELYQELAEAQYLNGNHVEARKTIEILLNQAQSLKHKITAFSLLKNLLVTLGQDYGEILRTGLQLMRECGLEFPQVPDQIQQNFEGKIKQDIQEAIGVQLKSIQHQLSKYPSVSHLITLPILKDTPETLKMKLCMECYEAAFYNGARDLILLTALNLVNLSLSYGNCTESSFGYVLYGMYLVEKHDFQQGYDFGNLALNILHQFNDSVLLPKVRNLFCNYINYHLQPFSSNANFYCENIRISRLNGEIIFGVWATIFYIWSLFLSGQTLEKIYQESEKYWSFAQQTNDLKMIKVLQLIQLVILSLQGKTNPRSRLQTESLDVRDLLQFWQDHNFINGLTWYAILQGQVLYTYGFYREAIEVIKTYAQELSPDIIMFPISQYYIYYPLALAAAYPELSSSEQSQVLADIEEGLQKLEAWQHYCPENFQSSYFLLQAEIAKFEGKKAKAMDFYDQAIVTAQTYQNLPQQALANERAGVFWLSLNKPDFASLYLSKAYYQYQLWGAEGKIKDLTDQYPVLLLELSLHRSERSLHFSRESTNSESSKTRNIGLDLDSVLQVSQTLASEMNLEKLLEKIMKVVIENSGAELGYLLIEYQQNWIIKASGLVENQEVIVDFPINLEESQKEVRDQSLETIPRTIVNYVARTQQPVILNDSSLTHPFLNDPYFKTSEPTSVLCLPLTHQSKLLGLLYLENKLTKSVFTDDRLRTLQIITSQAAISLENAQLYNQLTSYSKTLETKVRLRTEELELAKDAADRANQSKSEFLSSMSHELRTPLNVILGFTQVMNRDSSLSSEQRENLDIISRSGEHLLTLINDILDLSKIDAGNITVDQGSFDLYGLLNTLEQMLGVKATHKNLDLIFDISPHLPRYIEADAKKLRQILINLLSNALKFTSKGGVTLRASYNTSPDWHLSSPSGLASYQEADQHLIKFEVEDTGIGIDPNDLDRIFDPFVQTNTAQTFIEGTGLGLAISRKFANLMGGQIEISSELNRGTIVKLILPVILAQPEDVKLATSPKRFIKIDSDQDYRILIAEDRLESRNLLIKLLKPLGFQVEAVANGQIAIEVWENWSPHVILMDMRMPVMNGYDATKYIKRHLKGQATIIIALTASAFSDDKTVILSAGCDDFLGKPFREEVLLEKISQHLGIQYLCEEITQTHRETTSGSSPLTPEDLQVMPSDWIQALYRAASEADSDVLEQLIHKIPSDHSNLAIILQNLVDNFGYDRIINLTQIEG